MLFYVTPGVYDYSTDFSTNHHVTMSGRRFFQYWKRLRTL